MAVAAIVALVTSQVAVAPACAAQTAGTAQTAGVATHYVLDELGNCGFPRPPANGLYVALSPAEYDGAAACGSYVEVHGPDGTVTAEVIDQCPPCQTGHVDLSEGAFSAIAPLAAGEVSVSYQTIADPALPGPIQVEVKEGSSPFWLALLVMNTGNAVASVRIGSTSLTRATYNYWIALGGLGSGPFTVEVTDTAGHEATLTGIRLEPGVVQQTGVSMYGAPAPRATQRQIAEKTPAAIMPSRVSAAPGITAVTVRTPRAAPSCR